MKKDILIYFTGKIIPAAVNLVMIILAVRILGKEEYGRYSLILYATMLLSTFAFGWIQQSILRFLTAYSDDQGSILQQFLKLSLSSAAVAFTLGLGIVKIYFTASWPDTMVVSAYSFLYILFLFHLTLFQARRESAKYAIFEGVFSVSYLLLFITMARFMSSPGYIVIFIAMGLGLLLSELARKVALSGSPANPGNLPHGHEPGFVRKVFRFGFPITLWLLISYLVNISDRFIIKEFTTYGDVGTYSAVKDLILKISTFTTIPVILSYHPMIMERWNKGDRREATRLIRQGFYLCLIIGIVISAGFLVARDFLYERILHLQVAGGLQMTLSLLGSSFLWQIALILHKPLELLLKPGLMLVAITLAFAVNVILNIFLVPVYGYPAAALISLLSVMIYTIMILAFLLHFRKRGLLP